jgi:hypothetical protein
MEARTLVKLKLEQKKTNSCQDAKTIYSQLTNH